MTMVAQWRWLQAFIPQVGSGTNYTDSANGGTVEITSVTNTSDTNYNAAYNANGGKSYHAETDETVTATATAKDGFTFEGWYDASGKLVTTNATYTYVETKESVNTYYARFSGSVTQTYIRQVKNGDSWKGTEDDKIGTLGRYTYTDAVGTPISSTATAGTGYKFVGWYDADGKKVTDTMLSNRGATISYTTAGDATYYARFSFIEYRVTYDLNGGSSTPEINDGNIYYHSTVDSEKSTISVTKIRPTKEGYVFDGWELVGSPNTVDSSISVDNYWSNTAVVGDLTDGTGVFTLKAKWTTEPQVTINYMAIPSNGGSVSRDSETVPVSTGTVSGSTATAHDGYYFVGWYEDPDCTGTPVSINASYAPEKAAATYYAKFALKEPVVITVTGKTVERTYNGNPQSVNTSYDVVYAVNGITTTALPEGISFSLITDSDKISGTNASTYTGTLRQDSFTITNTTAKYTVQLVVIPGQMIINPKPVTVKADDNGKVSGEPDPTLTATVTGTIGSDTVNYTVYRAGGEDVGAYTITASGEEKQGNYKVIYKTGTFTITDRTTSAQVRASSGSKVYDGTPLAASAKVTGAEG